MLKAINLLKVLSVSVFLGALLLVYAYSPVMMKLSPESSELQIHRESFFYFAVAIFVIINIALLAFQRLYERHIERIEVKAWVRGFTFILNFYFALIIGFIGVINNTAHLNPDGFAYLNYMGPVMIFSWLVGLFYLAKRRVVEPAE